MLSLVLPHREKLELRHLKKLKKDFGCLLLSVHHVPHALEILPLLQLHKLLEALQLLRLGARRHRHQLLVLLLPQAERRLSPETFVITESPEK